MIGYLILYLLSTAYAVQPVIIPGQTYAFDNLKRNRMVSTVPLAFYILHRLHRFSIGSRCYLP